jgi:hypothetical protein
MDLSQWMKRAAFPYAVIALIGAGAVVWLLSQPGVKLGGALAAGGVVAAILLVLYLLDGGIIEAVYRLVQFFRWTCKGVAPDCRTCDGRGVVSSEPQFRAARMVLIGGLVVVALGLAVSLLIAKGVIKI